ncbi:MAG: acylphosphatase [Sulfuricella sp.]|nr:acylphosphatase [Sulfuricella sp.]
MNHKITRHLTIHGRVQGVSYRESLREQAENHAVTGWVRNRRNGTVEATLHGGTEDVHEVIAWCRRGPPLALVEHVEVDEGQGEFSDFERLGTV